MKWIITFGLCVWVAMSCVGQSMNTFSIRDNSCFKVVDTSQGVLTDPFGFFGHMYEVRPTFGSARNSYNVNHLPGLFCKLEYKLESRSKLAPRIRLGSLRYANWMEGKLPAWSTTGY